MEKFENKVAIVTGASAGIGACIAKMLLDHGVIVVGLARRKEKIEEIFKDRTYRGTLHALKCDVSKPEEVVESFRWVEENVGSVTVLVNNAAIANRSRIISGDVQSWRDTFDTNVIGLSVACREAVSRMTKNNVDGIIINVSSMSGHRVLDLQGFDMYIASKHALRALTESIRLDLIRNKSKIRISTVSPGIVDTDIYVEGGHFTQEEYADVFKKTEPYMAVEDVANAVKYILSNPPHVQVLDILLSPVGAV